MTKQIQLIKLYCAVCQHYNSTIVRNMQRLSNNFCPKFTDEECITIYLFGISEQKYTVKAIYEFIEDYYAEWFPDMPTYQNFNRRICNLADAFRQIAELLLSKQEITYDDMTYMIDSMPIVVANEKRSEDAKTAGEMCNKGYCGSKKMYYYGVKLHALVKKQEHALPKLSLAWISPASEHDLSEAKHNLDNCRNMDVFGDKAYGDIEWNRFMSEYNNVNFTTPVKLEKGQARLNSADKLYNSLLSSIRQPIESFFNWIQEKTKIQSASKVRSSNGLTAFVFARLAAISLF